MVPAANINFFTDSAAAAGALIGLLFVAISLRTDSVFGDDAPTGGRALAGSAFTALVNAFFISIMASIPNVNLGIVVIVLAVLALYTTTKLHRHLAQREAQVALLIFSITSYLTQVAGGIWLALRPHQRSLYDALCYVIVSSFAMALLRAWSLLQGSYLTPSRRSSTKADAPESE